MPDEVRNGSRNVAVHLTRNPAYETVERDDFKAMVDVDPYERRSHDFDEIISATHDNFGDPNNKTCVDFDQLYDMKKEYLMSPQRIQELRGAVLDRLDEGQQIQARQRDYALADFQNYSRRAERLAPFDGFGGYSAGCRYAGIRDQPGT